jgi:hypothetical protein
MTDPIVFTLIVAASATFGPAAWLVVRFAWLWITQSTEQNMDGLVTYDGTHVRLYVLKRGTKAMRVYAGYLTEAMDIAERHKFRPPYDCISCPAVEDNQNEPVD